MSSHVDLSSHMNVSSHMNLSSRAKRGICSSPRTAAAVGCAALAQEPALSEVEGVGFHGSVHLGLLHLMLFMGGAAVYHGSVHLGLLHLISFLGGAAVYRCDKWHIFIDGFSR